MRVTKPVDAAYTIIPDATRLIGAGDLPDARWKDAIRDTVALWSFVLLMNLPAIVHLHAGQGVRSVLLDCSTILVSMALAMPLFALFRSVERMAAVPRLVLLAGAVVALSIVQAGFDLLFTAWIAQTLETGWRTMATDLRRGYGAALNYAGVFAVNLALFQIAYSRRAARRHERRLAELSVTHQAAELESLRTKLDPHFLFNTLNVLSGLVVTRRNEEADRLIERLSIFLRASLATDPGRLVPLENELAMVEHYARIEEARFGERLTVEIDCAGAGGGVLVPALTIQPLVERAVRDGLGDSTAPVRIRVHAALDDTGGVRIVVADDAPRATAADPAETLHLRRRLRVLYGDDAGVRATSGGDGMTTTIVLPAATA